MPGDLDPARFAEDGEDIPDIMERGQGIHKGSPFTAVFRDVQAHTSGSEEKTSSTDLNPYFCPQVIQTLFKSYLGIFPLWSGVLLGDLSRHTETTTCRSEESRDSNCHVEAWFGIVKQSILQHKRKLRPAQFVRQMHSSLRGRYRENVIMNSLELRPIQPIKKITGNFERGMGQTKLQQAQIKVLQCSPHYSSPKKDFANCWSSQACH